MLVWPPMLKGAVGGLSGSFPWTISSHQKKPFSHPKFPWGGWRVNSPAGNTFPVNFWTFISDEWMPEWTIQPNVFNPFGRREKKPNFLPGPLRNNRRKRMHQWSAFVCPSDAFEFHVMQLKPGFVSWGFLSTVVSFIACNWATYIILSIWLYSHVYIIHVLSAATFGDPCVRGGCSITDFGLA